MWAGEVLPTKILFLVQTGLPALLLSARALEGHCSRRRAMQPMQRHAVSLEGGGTALHDH